MLRIVVPSSEQYEDKAGLPAVCPVTPAGQRPYAFKGSCIALPSDHAYLTVAMLR